MRDIIQDNSWNLERLYTPLPESVLQSLLAIPPILCPTRRDAWIGKVGNSGTYSVRDAYAWLNDAHHDQLENRKIGWVWKLQVPEKVRMFVWLIVQDAIQVIQFRVRCHLATDATCMCCTNSIEDGLHCLRDCSFSWNLWQRLGATNWPNFRCSNISTWVSSLARGAQGVKFLAGL